MENRSFRKKRRKSQKPIEKNDEIIDIDEIEEIDENKPFPIQITEVINLNEDDDEDDYNDELNETPKFNDIDGNSSKSEDEKCIDEDCESMDEFLDEERMTLGIINNLFTGSFLSRKKKREKSLKNKEKEKDKDKNKVKVKEKKCFDNAYFVYDQKNKKIEELFCQGDDVMNDFINQCQAKTISIQNIPSCNNKINNSSFDPVEWMKSKNLFQRSFNFEDLSIYCNRNNKNDENQNLNDSVKKIIIKKKSDIIEEKLNQFVPNFKDDKQHKNYEQLKKILSSQILSKEQKAWINEFIREISQIDIKDIKIEKDKQGKEQKLDIIFDLDNTIIFSFLSSEDNLMVQSKKDFFPKKEVRMISFNFNDIVIYTILILRKGFKEFIQYAEPLCTFHISTLGCENYGNEVKNILNEYTGISFIRYKGRINSSEYTKSLDDLFLSKERAIIFDDNVNVWKNKDNEHVINTKYFYDEECAMLNQEKLNRQNSGKTEREDFKKTYKFFYNRMNSKNWLKQDIKECTDIPFYQFKQMKDFNFNKCFTAEYLSSEKYQFLYMKDVIKEIYILKFVYGIDIPMAIKLIRMGTLANMKFNLKYLLYFEKNIIYDMIKSCGGELYDGTNRENDEKVYLIVTKRAGLKRKKDEILKDLSGNNFYVLINEKFIIDTYYFMTNLTANINDPEYKFSENEK